MGKTLLFTLTGISLFVLILISIFGGFFNAWTFFGLAFYIIFYIVGYAYVRLGMKSRRDELDSLNQRKQKFDWCWNRVNQILQSMPGGQGIEWSSGVGRKSAFKTFYDGTQNKPYRSIMAHLQDTQQLVSIVYDIDGDDIAVFIANPSADIIENPFLNFKPFDRGSSGGMGGMSGYRGSPGYYPNSRYRSGSRSNRGISINVGGDEYQDENYEARFKPKDDQVNKVLDTLKD